MHPAPLATVVCACFSLAAQHLDRLRTRRCEDRDDCYRWHTPEGEKAEKDRIEEDIAEEDSPVDIAAAGIVYTAAPGLVAYIAAAAAVVAVDGG